MYGVAQVFTFIIFWSITIFILLPWGNKYGARSHKGEDRGAPSRIFLARKLIISAFLAAIMTLGLEFFLHSPWLEKLVDMFPI